MIGDEIIRAWNEEIHLANYVDESYRNGIDISLIKNTLDLINHLQAEKEALIAGQETLQKSLAEKNAEIEELKLENEELLYPKYGIQIQGQHMYDLCRYTRSEATKYALEWLQANRYINFAPERRKEFVKEIIGE